MRKVSSDYLKDSGKYGRSEHQSGYIMDTATRRRPNISSQTQILKEKSVNGLWSGAHPGLHNCGCK